MVWTVKDLQYFKHVTLINKASSHPLPIKHHMKRKLWLKLKVERYKHQNLVEDWHITKNIREVYDYDTKVSGVKMAISVISVCEQF